jgi:hypothetical protein
MTAATAVPMAAAAVMMLGLRRLWRRGQDAAGKRRDGEKLQDSGHGHTS